MSIKNLREEMRLNRKNRIRKKVFGTSERPRLTVFRSLKHIYAQIIDDSKGHTIVSASTVEENIKQKVEKEKNIAKAVVIGKLIAQRALEKGVKKVVFDRNGFLYHGRIKAVSDGAREAGLNF
ncbi:MAG: 50S ribosomal protein L18 [Desulfobacterales bacterium]|nr:50S ribosomal protein L18 [Desulfobacterales bacterium]MBF0396460.1 50S ribosomal protein L18 [Desulfobacterales bacterium]